MESFIKSLNSVSNEWFDVIDAMFQKLHNLLNMISEALFQIIQKLIERSAKITQVFW